MHVDGGNDLAVVEREGEAGESASETKVNVKGMAVNERRKLSLVKR